MPQKWTTIQIFISSTFLDMHTERDRLLRFVFPKLKEQCRKNHVHVIDVDLRWGVSEKDVQEGKALDICLEKIDSCRPFFLGLLGYRYGWVPQGGDRSITANEIYHAVLHNNIPEQLVDLNAILKNKHEDFKLNPDQLSTLVKCYLWDGENQKYRLRKDISEEQRNIIRSVFRHLAAYQKNCSFFFFRTKGLTRQLAQGNKSDFFEVEPDPTRKLELLKQKIKNQGLWWTEYDHLDPRNEEDKEAFCRKVEDILWDRIKAELQIEKEEETTWLEDEADLHDLFIEDRTLRFVGRWEELDVMRRFCHKRDSGTLLLTGEAGCGKSALMGLFTREIQEDHPDWLIIPHFVGASNNSANLRQTLRRFCSILHHQLNLEEEIPEDINELRKVFPGWLEKAATRYKIIVIVDAVNQMESIDNAHALQWLPQVLPQNVKCIISALKGDALDALQIRTDICETITLKGLDESSVHKLVYDYLSEFSKSFPNDAIEQCFFKKLEHGNPLYILVALEELRMFGLFEALEKRIDALPLNVDALFDQVLDRIENDFPSGLIRDSLSFIASGRQGLAATELQDLLKYHAPIKGSPKLPDMIWVTLSRAFGTYLFERSGVIDFFHNQFKEAVRCRYLSDETAQKLYHQTIADYFESRWSEPYNRALDEMPYQMTHAENWEDLEHVLCDLIFIEKKCAAGMLFGILYDCDFALQKKDLSGIKQMRDALFPALPALSARPDKTLQTIYNRLIWFEDLSLVLSTALEKARKSLNKLSIWIKAEAPLPEPKSSEKIIIPFKIKSDIQSISIPLKAIATASFDGNLEVRKLINGELLLERKLNSSKITSIALGSTNGQIAYMDMLGLIQTMQYNTSLKGRIHEMHLLYHPSGIVLAVREDHSLVLWDPNSNEIVELFKGLPIPVLTLKTNSNDTMILFIAGRDDQVIGISTLMNHGWETKIIPYAGARLIDAALDYNSKIILIASQDRYLKIIDINNSTVINELAYEAHETLELKGVPQKCTLGLVNEKNLAFCATLKGNTFYWDWRQNIIERLEDWRCWSENLRLVCFEFIPSLKQLLVSTNDTVRIISKESTEKFKRHHSLAVNGCTIIHSKTIVSFSENDHAICWFSAEGLEPLGSQSYRNPTAIAPVNHEEDVIIGNIQGDMWRQPIGKKVIEKDIYMVVAEPVVSLFSRDNRNVVVAGKSGRVVQINCSNDKADVLWKSTGFRTQKKIIQVGDNSIFWSLYSSSESDGAYDVISRIYKNSKEEVILKTSYTIHDMAVNEKKDCVAIAGSMVKIIELYHNQWKDTFYREKPSTHIGFVGNDRFIAVILSQESWLEILELKDGLPTVAAIDLPAEVSCFCTCEDRIVVGFLSGELMSLRCICSSKNPFKKGK